MTVKQGAYAPVQETETAVPVVTTVDNTLSDDTKVDRFEVVQTPQTWTRGEVQESGYKDVYFAVVFLAQLAIVLGVALLFAFGVIQTSDSVSRRLDGSYPYSNNNENENEDSSGSLVEFERVFAVLVVSLVISPIAAVMALGLMKEHAVFLIQFSLLFSVGLNALLAAIALFVNPVAAIIHVIFAAILGWYAKVVWHRIPYAASNLKSAITAIKMNLGIALLSFSAVPIRIGWLALWFYTFYETLQMDFMTEQIEPEDVPYQTDDALNSGTTETTVSPIGYFIIILFFLSLYWTAEVIKVSDFLKTQWQCERYEEKHSHFVFLAVFSFPASELRIRSTPQLPVLLALGGSCQKKLPPFAPRA